MAVSCVQTMVTTCKTTKVDVEEPKDARMGVQDISNGRILDEPVKETAGLISSSEQQELAVTKFESSSKRDSKPENKSPKLSPRIVPNRLRMYVPPNNFGSVEDGHVYRSGYPTEKNFDFIASLRVKTILTLVPEPLSTEYSMFMRENGIRHVQIHIPANKDGVVNITPERMGMALAVVLNRANHPMLIHCNRGKHRTGCVTACFRKVQSMNTEAALTEYQAYASPKCRDDDMKFIRGFDETQVFPFAQSHGWPVTPPPEPTEHFWHLKKDSMTFALEDIAALKLPESDPDQSL